MSDPARNQFNHALARAYRNALLVLELKRFYKKHVKPTPKWAEDWQDPQPTKERET